MTVCRDAALGLLSIRPLEWNMPHDWIWNESPMYRWNSGQKLLSSLEFSLKGRQRQPSLTRALPLRKDTARIGDRSLMIRTTKEIEFYQIFQHASYIQPNLAVLASWRYKLFPYSKQPETGTTVWRYHNQNLFFFF